MDRQRSRRSRSTSRTNSSSYRRRRSRSRSRDTYRRRSRSRDRYRKKSRSRYGGDVIIKGEKARDGKDGEHVSLKPETETLNLNLNSKDSSGSTSVKPESVETNPGQDSTNVHIVTGQVENAVEKQEKLRRRRERMEAWKRKQEQKLDQTKNEDSNSTVAKKENEAIKQESKEAVMEEEEDPLDAFMKQTETESKKQIAAALAKECEEAKIVAQGGTLDVEPNITDLREDEIETMMKNNKRCYVCKQFGHTKRDCPDKKCTFCYKPGHIQRDCGEWKAELERRALEEKKANRRKFYENKKVRRREERIHKLRCETGVYGFQKLYQILGLPTHKLASMVEIKKAFNKQSLVWHPDKRATKSEEEQERAAEKYAEIRDAYDLLLEGLERGNLEGKAVVNAGDITNVATPNPNK